MDTTRTRSVKATIALLLLGLIGLQGCQAVRTADLGGASAPTSLVAGRGSSLTPSFDHGRRLGDEALLPVCCNFGFGGGRWLAALLPIVIPIAIVCLPLIVVFGVLTSGM